MYLAMELCGRGRTIPEPDHLGQSVGSAPICLRPPIPPPSTGCRPGTGSGPIRSLRRHTVPQFCAAEVSRPSG